MPVVRICRHCRQRYTAPRCPCRPPRRGSDSAARQAQQRFRDALLAQSDGQCAYLAPDGVRCPVTIGLAAAHVGTRYADRGGFDAGAMLCAEHHRRLDRGT